MFPPTPEAGFLVGALRSSIQRQWVSLAGAMLILNVSLSFRNLRPTPAVWWAGDLSLELGIGLLLLLLATRRGRQVPPRALGILSVVWAVLVFGRYADVTTPALLGREINLFWDLRFGRDVIEMFARAVPWWLVALIALGLLVLVWSLHRLLRWSLGRVAAAASDTTGERRRIAVTGIGLVLLFALERTLGYAVPVFAFAAPVTQMYVRQVRLVRDALGAASRELPPTPPMNSDLALVAGADVILMFMESYGAVTWQRPDFIERLAPLRAQLSASIGQTGRGVVSGFVEAPTYGGSSWFAHISLLSGVDIRDPNANALLMTQRRDTLVTAFGRRGFRTIALMPGLWQAWPEGAFYGFQEIYGGGRLDYRGPQFGWWDIPDQFALAKLDELELGRQPKRPLFVFFPTVSTHTPFTPTPPYQPDWVRMLSAQPFDDKIIEEVFDRQPDWTNLSPSYGDAMAYAHEVVAGYLRQHADRDLVLIVLGDHQPPALVSGEGQPWDVPVHVIAAQRDILDRLRVLGFSDGLDPSGDRIAKMHELLPILLDAFGNREPEPGRLAGHRVRRSDFSQALIRRGTTVQVRGGAPTDHDPIRTPTVKLRPRAGAN